MAGAYGGAPACGQTTGLRLVLRRRLRRSATIATVTASAAAFLHLLQHVVVLWLLILREEPTDLALFLWRMDIIFARLSSWDVEVSSRMAIILVRPSA